MFMEETAKVLIADDHPLFRDALRQVVDDVFDSVELREAACAEDALAAAAADDLDLILLDINMPGMNGFTGMITLRNAAPATPIIVVSADEAFETIRQALTLGAAGFIPKSLDKVRMAEGVRTALAGDVFVPVDLRPAGRSESLVDEEFRNGYAALTAQQRKVLEMLVMGKPNKVIAYELDIAESTVKAHVSAILRKLRVNSRTQAVLNASKMLGHVRAMPM